MSKNHIYKIALFLLLAALVTATTITDTTISGVTELNTTNITATSGSYTTITQGGNAVLDTSTYPNLDTDSTDDYATSDFNTDLATKTTADLSEGANLYYTEARVNSTLNEHTLVYTDSNGNIGLNISDPTNSTVGAILNSGDGILHIYDSDRRARLVLSGPLGPQFDMIDSGGSSNTRWARLTSDAGTFELNSVNDAASGFTVDNIIVADLSSGNVGIGTSSPTRSLDVVSTDQDVANFTGMAGGSAILNLYSDNGNDEYYEIKGQDNAYFLFAMNGSNMGGFNPNSDFYALNNLGVGTNSPTKNADYGSGALLEVDGANPVIQLDATNNAVMQIDRGSASSRNEIVYQSAGANKWFTGLSDSDDAGDGTEFFIGTTSGGASPFLWLENTGNVGIGTSSPQRSLHVAGNSYQTGNAFYNGSPELELHRWAWATQDANLTFGSGGWDVITMGFDDDSSTTWRIMDTYGGTKGTILSIDDDLDVTFGDDVIITDNLEVQGNIVADTPNNGYGGIKIHDDASGNYHSYIDMGRDSASAEMIFRMRARSGNSAFGTGSELEALKLYGSGNVEIPVKLGIGGTPAYELSVIDTGGAAIVEIQADSSSTSNIWLADQDSDSVGRIRYEHTGNKMEFWANSAEILGLEETLIGTYTGGSAHVCVYDNGTLFASDAACA